MRGRRFAWLAALPVLVGCELDQMTIVDVEPVVVAEVYANVERDPDESSLLAFLHWTAGIDTAGLPSLSQSRVTVRAERGLTFLMQENANEECAGSFAPEELAVCFLGDPALTPLLRPGDRLEVDIELPDGGSLFGATRLPATFELDGLPASCRLAPNSLLPVRWSRSDGAWAYINETLIRNLPDALRAEGIVVEEDPLYLLGLSISDQDTTIVFPSEFGVFNRFELDQDLALRLQTGLPANSVAEVTITAVDRNYVNWARGGNFNPSGQVRVPSLRGDGTGVFGSTVNRRFVVVSDWDSQLPTCSDRP